MSSQLKLPIQPAKPGVFKRFAAMPPEIRHLVWEFAAEEAPRPARNLFIVSADPEGNSCLKFAPEQDEIYFDSSVVSHGGVSLVGGEDLNRLETLVGYLRNLVFPLEFAWPVEETGHLPELKGLAIVTNTFNVPHPDRAIVEARTGLRLPLTVAIENHELDALFPPPSIHGFWDVVVAAHSTCSFIVYVPFGPRNRDEEMIDRLEFADPAIPMAKAQRWWGLYKSRLGDRLVYRKSKTPKGAEGLHLPDVAPAFDQAGNVNNREHPWFSKHSPPKLYRVIVIE
ncbi:hypothetical protein F4780DRAFT_778311 [Xylariomycetidae sp. FL0641]|nr:hypothetical protein F4780DRAFT_778311 [Xylariomycetidae sp. FL0641]